MPQWIGPEPAPWISQEKPAGAPSGYSDDGHCVPTSVTMIARALGVGLDLSEGEMVARLGRIAETSDGTGRAGLYRMVRHLRLDCADFQGQDLKWAERHLRQGHYVLACGNPQALQRAGGLGGHAIVIDGFCDDAFRIKDPGLERRTEVERNDLWMFLMRADKAWQYALWR